MLRFVTRTLTGRNPFRAARHRHGIDAERFFSLATLAYAMWLRTHGLI